MTQPIIDDVLKKRMYADRNVRRKIVQESHILFFNFYFGDYVKCPTGDFHRDFFDITEDESIKMAAIVAFRGSAKSTIFTTSYPIWAILGKQQKKFVVIASQTQRQAILHLQNIKQELEKNDLLAADLGPFKEESDQWGLLQGLVIPGYNAKIVAVSRDQSIRGFRHGAYRPDLIVGDDLEDLESTRTKEGRDKTFNWFTAECIQGGDFKQTKIIVVGNLLHEDSLLKRIESGVAEHRLPGIYKEYPLINPAGKLLWPGKYETNQDIEQQKLLAGNENIWQREYLLRILPEDDQVIQRDWVHYYDELPHASDESFRYAATGVDLAITQKTTSDYTSMVSARLYGYESDMRIYILPYPINKRMLFPETLAVAKQVCKDIGQGKLSKMYIEQIQYQASLVQQLIDHGYPAEGIVVHGDKRSRLALLSSAIQSGKILFPKKGCEELIQQLVGFGVEKHDDLVDAFTLLLGQLLADTKEPMMPEVFIVSMESHSPLRRSLANW